MNHEADHLKLWIDNDEELYTQARYLIGSATDIPDAVERLKQWLMDVLDYDNLSAFQLEFMPHMDSWRVMDMLEEHVKENMEPPF